MVVLGVIIFAGASALCGATPRGSAAEAWLVAFRALQGLGGAIMFPAAIVGGYLIEWTWRAIFWINIPVALIALALIAISRPPNDARPAPLDYRAWS